MRIAVNRFKLMFVLSVFSKLKHKSQNTKLSTTPGSNSVEKKKLLELGKGNLRRAQSSIRGSNAAE